MGRPLLRRHRRHRPAPQRGAGADELHGHPPRPGVAGVQRVGRRPARTSREPGAEIGDIRRAPDVHARGDDGVPGALALALPVVTRRRGRRSASWPSWVLAAGPAAALHGRARLPGGDAAVPHPGGRARERRPRLPHGVRRVDVRRDAASGRSCWRSGRSAIGMVLGTGLAWAATRIPHRWRILATVPIVPIIVPAVANVTGWVFMLSPAARLPQRPAAQAAVVERPRLGPRRHLHAAVDRHPHRVRADGVRLPLRQRRPAQRQRRADRGGDGQRVVEHGGVLPDHRAAAAPGAALRRRRRPAARPRPVHGAAAARTQRRHQRADDRHLPVGVAEPDRLLGRRRHRVAADRDRSLRRRLPAHRARRPAPLRHPRRQVVPHPGAAVEAGRRRAHRSTARWRRSCRSAPSSSWRCRRSGARRSDVGRVHARQLPSHLRRGPGHRGDRRPASSCRSSRSRSPCPVGFVASSLLLRSRIPRLAPHDARPDRRAAARHPGRRLRRRLPAPVHPRARSCSTAAAGWSSSCT